MPTKLKKLLINRVDVVDNGANPDAHILLFKRDIPVPTEEAPMAETATLTPPPVVPATMPETMPEEPQPDALAQALARVAELEAQQLVTKREVQTAFEKRVADAEAEVRIAKAHAQEAQAIAKRERDAREQREYIEKMQAYQGLPVKPTEDWMVLKALDSLAPEYHAARDRALELLSAADEAMHQSGVLKRIGHSGSDGSGDAWSKIEAHADTLIAKSQSPITRQAAISQAMQAHPDLYQQYNDQRKGR